MYVYIYAYIYIKIWKSYFYRMTIFKYQFIDNINCFVYILFHLTIYPFFFFSSHFLLVLLCTPGWLCTLYEIKAGL